MGYSLQANSKTREGGKQHYDITLEDGRRYSGSGYSVETALNRLVQAGEIEDSILSLLIVSYRFRSIKPPADEDRESE